MKQSTWHIYYIIGIIILSFMTLGGLGNAAVLEHFYWFPFFLNLGFYGFTVYKLYKRMKELEKEGK